MGDDCQDFVSIGSVEIWLYDLKEPCSTSSWRLSAKHIMQFWLLCNVSCDSKAVD